MRGFKGICAHTFLSYQNTDSLVKLKAALYEVLAYKQQQSKQICTAGLQHHLNFLKKCPLIRKLQFTVHQKDNVQEHYCALW